MFIQVKSLILSLSLLSFFSLCGSLHSTEETSYSLKDGRGIPLDQKLIELMNFKNGTFIEVGACDGVKQSNTKRLEEYHGWTGVLIEPSEVVFKQLQANRPNSHCFNCALGSFQEDGTEVWGDFDGSLMSSIDGWRIGRPADKRIMMRSLQSILDEVHVSHINFFSLDTEGYETNVLKGIDFDRTTFDYILVEIYHAEFDEIVNFLSDKGYELKGNFSMLELTPLWDGTHNDYLFQRKQ